jgi:hypothetical protein
MEPLDAFEGALLSHVIGVLWLSAGLFSDQPPKYPMVPGGLPSLDRAILALVAGEARPVGDIASHLDITPQAVSIRRPAIARARAPSQARPGDV